MYLVGKHENGEQRFFNLVGAAFVQFEEGGEVKSCYVGRPLDDTEAPLEYFLFNEARIIDKLEMLSLVGFSTK